MCACDLDALNCVAVQNTMKGGHVGMVTYGDVPVFLFMRYDYETV